MLLAAPPPKTPQALRAAIVSAAGTQKSVHYVSASTNATQTITIVCDAGVGKGIQQISFRQGKKHGHVTVIVVGTNAYLRGDAFTLTNFIGIKAAGATRYANKWIVVPASHPAFQPIAAAVTLTSAIQEFGVNTGTLSTAAGLVAGKKVLGVRATVKVSTGKAVDTLWARDGQLRLPVEETITRKGLSVTNTYSNWNERVVVRTPKGAVPIAKVLAASGGPAA
jgi:hypothetical protein